MKRIQAACLIQTIAFCPKDDNPTQFEKEMLKKEYENYKNLMDRRGTKYKDPARGCAAQRCDRGRAEEAEQPAGDRPLL